MIDFTSFKQTNKYYSGSNTYKISIIYDNEIYMIKFPKNYNKSSYSNNCINEYIGCKIFEIIGIPVQKTLLGTYNINGLEETVVACKDFTYPKKQFQDYSTIKNQVLTLKSKSYSTELSDIILTIDEQKCIDSKLLLEHFWNMFVVDALIANPNRNSSNWGLCYDEQTDTQCIAPVFACSSSLFEKASSELMSSVLGSSQELKSLIYDEPTSALLLNGKHINYYDFITSLKYEDCNEAIKRIVPKINLQAIQDMINDIPCINDIQKRFYITIINERKEKILDKAYELLMNR